MVAFSLKNCYIITCPCDTDVILTGTVITKMLVKKLLTVSCYLDKITELLI